MVSDVVDVPPNALRHRSEKKAGHCSKEEGAEHPNPDGLGPLLAADGGLWCSAGPRFGWCFQRLRAWPRDAGRGTARGAMPNDEIAKTLCARAKASLGITAREELA